VIDENRRLVANNFEKWISEKINHKNFLFEVEEKKIFSDLKTMSK